MDDLSLVVVVEDLPAGEAPPPELDHVSLPSADLPSR